MSKMLKQSLINGTYVVPDSSPSPSWSKESIIALATIFIMIFLSALGFMVKHRLRKLVSSRLGQRWSCMVAQDIELAPMSRVAISSSWVDMADVRRYQQETYTSFLRSRRGPRMSKFGSVAR